MRTWLAVLGVIAVIAVAGVGGYMIGQDASEKSTAGDGNTGDAGEGSGQIPEFTENDFRWNATVENIELDWTDIPEKVVHLVYYCPEEYSSGLVTLTAGERVIDDIRCREGTVYLTIDAGGLPLDADDLVLLNSAKEHLVRDPTMPTIAQ